MSPRPEALFVAHRIPYPPDKGDKIRSWRLFERLSERFATHLVAFVDDPEDFRHRDFLVERAASVELVPLGKVRATARSAMGFMTGEPLSLPYYRDGAAKAAIAEARRRPLAVEVGFSSTTAQYLGLSGGRRGSTPRVVDLCDADSAKWRAYSKERRFPISAVYAREARLLEAVEREIINSADAVFAVSREEAAVLTALPDVRNHVDWVGNGVDTDYFAPELGVSAEIAAGEGRAADAAAEIVFTGAMDYWANVDAALWFIREILPRVRAARPGVGFSVVGSRPAAELLGHNGRDGVRVTGRVADVRPYLTGARLAVAPMRIARGLQNKALEAMASGAPLVATSAAVEGLEAEAGRHLLVADGAEAFAASVVSLLGDDGLRARLASAARDLMVGRYGWRARLDRFDAILERVGAF